MYRYFIELVQIFHQLGAWQKRGLALWCCGVLLAESCQLSRVADALLAEKRGTAAALNKRLSRFLGNPRINDAGLIEVWIGWIVRCYGGEHWSILVDETKLSHHVSVMMVGLAYRGRAIPLLWRCYHPQQYPPEGQVELIGEMLSRLRRLVPTHIRFTVMADRGIGTSPKLIRYLERIGLDYLFRVQRACRLQLRNGKTIPLKQVAQPGKCWQGQGRVFKKAGWIACYVRVEWRLGEKEPWCLVTHCAHRTSADYAQRAWHEHSFRDLKSFGFNWHLSHVWQPHRLQRLLLILAISYSWILSQAVLYTPCERISPSRQAPRESLFRRGLRWFRQLKASPQPRKVYPDLYFCPDTPLRC